MASATLGGDSWVPHSVELSATAASELARAGAPSAPISRAGVAAALATVRTQRSVYCELVRRKGRVPFELRSAVRNLRPDLPSPDSREERSCGYSMHVRLGSQLQCAGIAVSYDLSCRRIAMVAQPF